MAARVAFRWAVRVGQRAVYGAAPGGGPASLEDVPLVRLDGTPLPPEELRGRVLLVVNVASRCGLTPQYEGLVALHERLGPRGLTVLGAPCNQFLGQEPGSAEQILEECRVTWGVDFPLLEKQEVNGAGRSPLYRWLLATGPDPADIRWNFEKFVVGRDGRVRARFSPQTTPDDPRLAAELDAALSVGA
jgi:glutathione peroxidase